MDEAPAVVVVGAASRDLVDEDERGWRLGGGASYSALALARLGFRVGALIVADDLAATSREMDVIREAGVDVRVVPGGRGPVFINIETPTGRVQHAPQVSDAALPDSLPATWRDARAWMFAPVAAEIGEEWSAVPPHDAVVGLGWQGMLRNLRAGSPVERLPPGPSALVRRADLVGVGTDDVSDGITPADLAAFMRPRATLLFTDGAHGGTAYGIGSGPDDLAARRWHSIPIERYVDPVGAGDTFLAAVFAARVDPSITAGWDGPDPDLRLGAACGSLILEGPGVYGVPYLSDAVRRMRGGDNPD
jgi:sugar/nucleoside kinase (ribokinase family)